MSGPRPKGASGASGRRSFDKFEYLKQIHNLPHSRNLTNAESRVLVAVFNFTDGHGRRAHPGVELLARRLDYAKPRNVEKLLAILTAKGYLVVESVGGGQGRATSYALALPADPAEPDPWADLDNPVHGGRGLDTEPRPPRTPNPVRHGRQTPSAMDGPSDQEQTTNQSAPPETSTSAQTSAGPDAAVWVDGITKSKALDAATPDQLEAERARQLEALRLRSLTAEGTTHADP